jgi:hypothetical protein
MERVLHGCAKTTHAVRTGSQRSQASVAALAEHFGINSKTVLKWEMIALEYRYGPAFNRRGQIHSID